jgi:hypothetical protein
MKKSTSTFVLIAVFTLGLAVSSCGSSKSATKCDGRKGTKTRMGNL